MNSDRVKQFISEQVKLIQDGSKVKAQKAHKSIMNPHKTSEELDEYDYIITKKPAKKRVEKYLQDLINQIVEENMD